MSDNQHFTATESRILAVLSDGKPHPRKELTLAVDSDGFCTNSNLNEHVRNIRKKLPEGHYIVCCLRGYSVQYQRVLLYSANGTE